MEYNAGVNINEQGWLPLHRNENLFLDEHLLSGIVSDIARKVPVNFYPDTNCHELKLRLAEKHQVQPENIFIGNGADEVLSALFFLFRKRFDSIHLPRVCFKMYNIFAAKYEYNVHYFNNYPVTDKASEISHTGFYVIDSPSSITGEIIDSDTLQRISSNKNNLVVLDNVYGDFCNEIITGVPENRIVIRHFSKFYGMAGLRIGYCIASKEIIAQLNKYKEPFNVNSLAMAVAVECLNRHTYFDEVARKVMDQKKLFEAGLREMGFMLSNSMANFTFIKHPHLTAGQLHEALMAHKIATRHFADDAAINEYLRVTIPPGDEINKVITALNGIMATNELSPAPNKHL